jgi:hypothetical protein
MNKELKEMLYMGGNFPIQVRLTNPSQNYLLFGVIGERSLGCRTSIVGWKLVRDG